MKYARSMALIRCSYVAHTLLTLCSYNSHARPGLSSARWGRTAPVPARAMTHEQAPAWRDPGGRHRDGPGAFPSEQHPPPSTAVPGGLRAGQASCCGAGGAGARGNACKWRRAVRVRLG